MVMIELLVEGHLIIALLKKNNTNFLGHSKKLVVVDFTSLPFSFYYNNN